MAYLAPCLTVLRSEINAKHPNRDKASDGWIGDAAHATRKSDHNPDPRTAIVRALDVDDDGMDKDEYRRCVLADHRTEYFIQDWVIYTRSNGFRPQKYTGSNGHTSHGHVSIRHGAQWENDTAPWGYGSGSRSQKKPVNVIVDEVIAGKWGNGEDRKNRLTSAGYNYEEVRSAVNAKLGSSQPILFSQIVDEVIAGEWGNDPDRARRLTAAGYDANAVQDEVNRKLGSSRPARMSLATLATQVINGEWGNGDERKRRLREAGYDYSLVQAEVNRRLR